MIIYAALSHFPVLSHGFSHGFPWFFPSFHIFPHIFPWFPHVFPMVFPCFPMVFPFNGDSKDSYALERLNSTAAWEVWGPECHWGPPGDGKIWDDPIEYWFIVENPMENIALVDNPMDSWFMLISWKIGFKYGWNMMEHPIYDMVSIAMGIPQARWMFRWNIPCINGWWLRVLLWLGKPPDGWLISWKILKKMDDLEVWTDSHIRQSSGYYGY